MMSAEQWYEYQGNYKKYGFDMKPQRTPVVKPKKKSSVTPKDKIAMMFLTVVVGIVCVAVIITSAYAANIKYDINKIIQENAVITGDIEGLTVKLNAANNLRTIEQRARIELGMVYPNPNEFIYIKPEQEPVRDFALLLKQEAYN